MNDNNNRPLKLAVCSPAYGGNVNAAQNRMWTEFGNAVGASSTRFRLTMFGFVDVNPVCRARNQALAHAMLHSSDWLFSIDSDTWVEASGDEDAGLQILRMISDADRAGAVLVSAAVVKRADEATTMMAAQGIDAHELAVYSLGEDGKHKALKAKWALTQPRRLVTTIDGGTTPIVAVGAACYAVNLNRLMQKGDQLIDPSIMYRFQDQLSEDLDFCAQIRERIGEGLIMVDPRVRTGHASRSFPLFTHPL